MNNSALKLFHELMKKGWIDRNDNSLMWNLVEDNEARDELDQWGLSWALKSFRHRIESIWFRPRIMISSSRTM